MLAALTGVALPLVATYVILSASGELFDVVALDTADSLVTYVLILSALSIALLGATLLVEARTGGVLLAIETVGLIVAGYWTRTAFVTDAPHLAGPAARAVLWSLMFVAAGTILTGIAWWRRHRRPAMDRPRRIIAGITSAVLVAVSLVASLVNIGSAPTDWHESTQSDVVEQLPRSIDPFAGRVAWTTSVTAARSTAIPGMTYATQVQTGLAIATGPSSPSDATTDQKAGVTLVDPETGARIWTYTRSDATRAPELAAVQDRKFVVARWPGEIQAVVLDAYTGKRVSRLPLERTVPIATGRHIYYSDATGVHALDSSGHAVWSHRAAVCDHQPAAYFGLRAVSGVVIATRSCQQDDLRGDGYPVLMLDESSGKELWAGRLAHKIRPLAVSVDEAHAFQETADGQIEAVDLRTGEVDWTSHLPQRQPCAGADTTALRLAVSDDHVAVVGCHGDRMWTLSRLDASTGELLDATDFDRQPLGDPLRSISNTFVQVVEHAETALVFERDGLRQVPLDLPDPPDPIYPFSTASDPSQLLVRIQDELIALR